MNSHYCRIWFILESLKDFHISVFVSRRQAPKCSYNTYVKHMLPSDFGVIKVLMPVIFFQINFFSVL